VRQHAGLDRVDRAARDQSDLLVGAAREESQLDHQALVRREAVEAVADPLQRFQRACTLVRRHRVAALQFGRQAAPLAFERLQGLVPGDPEDPRRDLGSQFESGGILPDHEHDVVDDLVDGLGRGKKTPQEAREPPAKAACSRAATRATNAASVSFSDAGESTREPEMGLIGDPVAACAALPTVSPSGSAKGSIPRLRA
jgi:hypothetical protein